MAMSGVKGDVSEMLKVQAGIYYFPAHDYQVTHESSLGDLPPRTVI